MGTLTIRIQGKDAEKGIISVDDLQTLMSSVKGSLLNYRQKKGQENLQVELKTKEKPLRLYLTRFAKGSILLDFSTDVIQTNLSDTQTEEEMYSMLVEDIKKIQSATETVELDREILTSIHRLNPLFKKGFERVEFSWSSNGILSSAVIDQTASKIIEQSLIKRVRNPKSITGLILEADFSAPQINFVLHSPTYGEVKCSASQEDMGTVLSGLMHLVKVTGEVVLEPQTGRITSLRVAEIDIQEGEASLNLPYKTISDFWTGIELHSLIETQQVQKYEEVSPSEIELPTSDEWNRYMSAIKRKRQPNLV